MRQFNTIRMTDWQKDFLRRLPYDEKRSNPLQQAGSFISSVVGMFNIPSLLAAPAALKDSGFIDKSGKFLYHKLNCTSAHDYFNGLMLDRDHYVDKSGNSVFDKVFNAAEDFSEGLAAVYMNRAWGFIDTSGKYVIAPKYQKMRSPLAKD